MLERVRTGPGLLENATLQDRLAVAMRSQGKVALTEFIINRYMQRADVWVMTPHLRSRNSVYIYECKISRMDYWRDVKAGKFEAYMDACHRFYFAVPKGLISVKELPTGVGLIEMGRLGGWRHVPRLGRYNSAFRVPEEQYQRAILRLALGKTTGKVEYGTIGANQQHIDQVKV